MKRGISLIAFVCLLAGALDGEAAVPFPLPMPSRPTQQGRVVAWGGYLPQYGQTLVPTGLTGVVAIAKGAFFSEALKSDGTVVAWGASALGEIRVPASLTNTVSIAANSATSLALKHDGTVVGWGYNGEGHLEIPVGLSGVVAVALGQNFSAALTQEGAVHIWGRWNQTFPSNVVAIAAGFAHIVALRSDGTVVAWGDNSSGQLNIPEDLGGVVAVAAGYHSVALKKDGTIVAWGNNAYGQTNVPAGLTNVVAISAQYGNTVVLKRDGTVVAWGDNTYGQTNVPPGLKNVVAVSAGYHTLALVGDKTAPSIVSEPTDQTVYSQTDALLEAVATGSEPLHYQWRKDGLDLLAKTDPVLNLTNVQRSDSGRYSVVVTNDFGSVTSRVVRLTVVDFGLPEISSDGEILLEDVSRFDQSTLSMSTEFANGTIFYTTDGSEPSFASQPYAGPFVISQTTTIRAIAYSLDFAQSAVNGPVQVVIVPTFPLNGSVTGQGTVTVTPSQARYVSGTLVTVHATPAAGWRFLRWEGDACGSAVGADVVMDGTKTVTAVFEAVPTYALSTATAGGGTILGNTGSPYSEGSVVNLTAQAAPGWQFVRWEGDGSETSASLAVTMDRAKSVQAVFGTSIGMTVAGAGTNRLSPSSGPYLCGSTVRITPRPALGSYFAVWGGAASGSASPLNLVVSNANPTISALFVALEANKVNVYTDVQGEGDVTVSPYLSRYTPGTPVTLMATPAPGWSFVRWEGDAGGTSTNTTVILDVSRTVTAVFQALPTCGLTATTPGGGTISGNSGSPYPEGSVAHLTAHPAAGWQFLGWQGDASGTDPNLAVTMDGAKTVQAIFGTAVGGNPVGSGVVTLKPAQGPYPYGSTVQLMATPAAGFDFAYWGNAAGGTTNPLDYIVTTANATICAQFVPAGSREVDLIVTTSGQGGVVAFPDQPHYAPWTAVTLTATPAAGWRFIQWQGDASGNANPLNLMLDRSRAVNAYFAMEPLITSQPRSATNLVGTDVVLSVGADGTAPLSYQWALNGTNIPGATAATLVLRNVQLTNDGSYSVTVANVAGYVASGPVRLTILAPARITTQPEGQTAYWGKGVSFHVNATGWPPVSYLWFKDGIPMWWATNATLTLTNLEMSDAGQYTVVVSNSVASVTSSPASLVVNPAGIALGLSPRLTIEGVVGKTYGIQYTLDVSLTNSWITLTNLVLTEPVQVWVDTPVDTTAPNQRKRFYRVVPVR